MRLRCKISLLILALGLPLAACDEDGAKDNADAAQVGDAPGGQKLEPEDDEKPDEKAKAPERAEATSKSAGTVKQAPPLPLDKFFKAEDVTSLAKGELRKAKLAGQEPSADYNNLRLHPAGRADYGAAVQIWKLENERVAAARVGEMRGQYLSVSDPAADAPVKDRSAFLSTRQNLWQYVFNPKGEPYVAAVSCDEKFCRDVKVVYEIGSKVNNRILKDGAGEKKTTKKPEKKTEKKTEK